MARWYVLQGPHATREQAEGAYAAMDRNHTRLRVAKLRDRTGPSLRERVAELEERLDSHRERLAAVEDFTMELRNAENTTVHRIGNLESDLLDLRTRIGDLEREPAPVPGMSDRAERERLFALRDRAACGCLFADCTKHGAFYYATEAERLEARAIAADFAREPAPVRTEPTPADPDRLAKVAFRADHDPRPELGWTWENIHEETRENYRAVAAAVAEACAVDRAAPLANEEPTDAGLARMIRSMTEALRSDAEIGRAIYDFGREHGRADADAALATENVTLAAKLRMAEKENATLRDRAEKAERELSDLRADLASLSAEMGLPPGMRPAEGELARLVALARSATSAPRDPLANPQHARDSLAYLENGGRPLPAPPGGER